MESVADRQFTSKSRRRRRCCDADNALRTRSTDVVVIHSQTDRPTDRDALTNRFVHCPLVSTTGYMFNFDASLGKLQFRVVCFTTFQMYDL